MLFDREETHGNAVSAGLGQLDAQFNADLGEECMGDQDLTTWLLIDHSQTLTDACQRSQSLSGSLPLSDWLRWQANIW